MTPERSIPAQTSSRASPDRWLPSPSIVRGGCGLAFTLCTPLVHTPPVSAEAPIVRLVYRSRRALDADHSAYLMHGGMLVPRDNPPPINTEVRLEVWAPDGECYPLTARVGRAVPGRGFLVSFEPEAAEAQQALDRAVLRPAFVAARDLEPPEAIPPEVEWLHAAGSTSAAALGDEPEAAETETATAAAKPRPGQSYLAVVVRYPTVLSYLPDAESLERTARLSVEGTDDQAGPEEPALLRLTLPGHNLIEVWSTIETVSANALILRLAPEDERYRRACLFPRSHHARNRREREEARGDSSEGRSVVFLREEMPEAPEKMPLRRRLGRMGMEDKINLALSGNREERMALAQDSNRGIHHYLLKNAKITIDEVAFMSRLPSLNPDVLDKIAENPGYTQNPAVTKALVFNPRTPIRTALRLLDRLPKSELQVIARRTGMNKRLVTAAKTKLTGGRWP